MLPNGDEVFTGELTSDTLIITQSMGASRISIFNGTAVVGTVTGAKYLGVLPPSALNVAEDSSVNITASDSASVLDGVTIVAPAGCTLSIIAIG